MEEASNYGSTTATTNPKAALQKCILILRSAKSDNERFAALLLVTQLVKSDTTDGAQRRELFDAVGFTFINRLLNTKIVPQDCDEGVFKSLAITMLACFSTDQELLFHPQMVAKIVVLNEIIFNQSDEESIIGDAYQILTSFASTPRGCEYLTSKGIVFTLIKVIRQNSHNADLSCELIMRMLHFHSNEMWKACGQQLVELLCFLSGKLKTLQDLTKFEVCKVLIALLSATEKSTIRGAVKTANIGNQWQVDICKGLKDILQSKVTPVQRDPALILMSLMTELNGGLDWALTEGEQSVNFFVFISTLISIEIRLILEESTPTEIGSKLSLLTACYVILENVISYLVTIPDKLKPQVSTVPVHTPPLDEDTKARVYSQVTEVMMCLLNFLQREETKNIQGICGQEKYVLFASARVLCCWLAEESLALQEDVLKVLPFLIKLAEESLGLSLQVTDQLQNGNPGKRVSFQEPMEEVDQPLPDLNKSSPPDVEFLQFMLPALCHLSADDKARKILIDTHMPKLLGSYYSVLWDRWSKNSEGDIETKTALTTLLGVLLNFAVTEPELVKIHLSFHDLQSHITSEIPKLVASSSHVVLVANLLVLGLMLTRHQKTTEDSSSLIQFFKAAIHFLKEGKNLFTSATAVYPGKQSPLNVACQEEWENMSELWFLGVQVLTASIGQFATLSELVKDSGWAVEIGQGLDQANSNQHEEELDIKEVLYNLYHAVTKENDS